MPFPVSPGREYAIRQEIDLDAILDAMSAMQSEVLYWNDRPILIYMAVDKHYYLTDIGDLPQSTVQQIATVPVVHGVLYQLPQAISDTVWQRAEQVSNLGPAGVANELAKAIADVAKQLGTGITPLLWPLAIVAGLILVLYFKPNSRSNPLCL